ncbi:bile acid:sodium symporter family protein [Falsiroseomonas sp. CW058]|uniref:bile acid:sodium symporter family protein n=1 Tax=Falsiroseomonas sp. CW058 TaxID=3388664 RepID=UPI003D31F669
MGQISAFLEWSARRGGALLGFGVFAGVLVPPLAAATRDVVTPVVACLMTLVLLRVDFGQVLGYLKRPFLVATLLVWVMLACPLIVFALVRAAGLDGPLGAAVVIMATGCAATSSPAFARLVGLDGEISLVVAVLSTLLVPFTAPPLALGLLGIDLAISLEGLMLRLALVVGLPLLISLAIRRIAGQARLTRHGRAVDGAVVLLVVLYGFGVMDGLQARILAEPLWVLGGVLLAFAGNFGLNLLTALAMRPLAGPGVALAAGLLSGNRNMALYLAVLPAATDPRILLFFALCQFPLFLSPFLLRPVYDRIRRHGA